MASTSSTRAHHGSTKSTTPNAAVRTEQQELSESRIDDFRRSEGVTGTLVYSDMAVVPQADRGIRLNALIEGVNNMLPSKRPQNEAAGLNVSSPQSSAESKGLVKGVGAQFSGGC